MGVADVISERLANGELVIIDGGTGSQLQAEGVPMDDVAWCARANLEQPDVGELGGKLVTVGVAAPQPVERVAAGQGGVNSVVSGAHGIEHPVTGLIAGGDQRMEVIRITIHAILPKRVLPPTIGGQQSWAWRAAQGSEIVVPAGSG